MNRFLRGLFGRSDTKAEASGAVVRDPAAEIIAVHKSYWTPAPAEKERLSAAQDTLEWQDLLRLHHLVCLDLMLGAGLAGGGRKTVAELGEDAEPKTSGPEADLCAQLARRLRGPDSPYRSRVAGVLLRPRVGVAAPEGPRKPTIQGALHNASITHHGAIEVIRLEGEKPTVVDFVPLDALRAVTIASPTLWPAARLDYELSGKASDVVFLPLLYGASWLTPLPGDRDGGLTRFMCHLEGEPHGMGIGHQDFTTGTSLFGLGSIEAIHFPLDPTAARPPYPVAATTAGARTLETARVKSFSKNPVGSKRVICAPQS